VASRSFRRAARSASPDTGKSVPRSEELRSRRARAPHVEPKWRTSQPPVPRRSRQETSRDLGCRRRSMSHTRRGSAAALVESPGVADQGSRSTSRRRSLPVACRVPCRGAHPQVVVIQHAPFRLQAIATAPRSQRALARRAAPAWTSQFGTARPTSTAAPPGRGGAYARGRSTSSEPCLRLNGTPWRRSAGPACAEHEPDGEPVGDVVGPLAALR
jgi:hypothetical protein